MKETGAVVKAAAHISGDGVKPFLLHSFLFVWFVQLSKGQAGLEVCFAKDWKAPGACISLLTLASPSWCLHFPPAACFSPLVLAAYSWCLYLVPGACISLLVLCSAPAVEGTLKLSSRELPQPLEPRHLKAKTTRDSEPCRKGQSI